MLIRACESVHADDCSSPPAANRRRTNESTDPPKPVLANECGSLMPCPNQTAWQEPSRMAAATLWSSAKQPRRPRNYHTWYTRLPKLQYTLYRTLQDLKRSPTPTPTTLRRRTGLLHSSAWVPRAASRGARSEAVCFAKTGRPARETRLAESSSLAAGRGWSLPL